MPSACGAVSLDRALGRPLRSGGATRPPGARRTKPLQTAFIKLRTVWMPRARDGGSLGLSLRSPRAIACKSLHVTSPPDTRRVSRSSCPAAGLLVVHLDRRVPRVRGRAAVRRPRALLRGPRRALRRRVRPLSLSRARALERWRRLLLVVAPRRFFWEGWCVCLSLGVGGVCVCVCVWESVCACARVCVRCSSRSPRRTPVVERLPTNEQEYPRPRHSKERRRTEEIPPPKRRVGTSSPGVFLSLVGALASLPRRSLARRAVTTLALSGVVARRVTSGAAAGSLLLSPTFLGAAALLAWSAETLVAQGGYIPVVRSRPPLLMNATTSLCRSAKKLVASQD